MTKNTVSSKPRFRRLIRFRRPEYLIWLVDDDSDSSSDLWSRSCWWELVAYRCLWANDGNERMKCVKCRATLFEAETMAPNILTIATPHSKGMCITKANAFFTEVEIIVLVSILMGLEVQKWRQNQWSFVMWGWYCRAVYCLLSIIYCLLSIASGINNCNCTHTKQGGGLGAGQPHSLRPLPWRRWRPAILTMVFSFRSS